MRIEQAITALLLAFAASLVTAQGMPDNLKPSAGEMEALRVKANGNQIYVCTVRKDDASKYEWIFKAPEAELFDAGTQRRIGKHYAGPTWESDDGSKVVGEVKARDNGPDANAIPWLLLTAKSNAGSGLFGKTTSIQRIDTKGGKVPVDDCIATMAGKEMRVPYTALYVFFNPR